MMWGRITKREAVLDLKTAVKHIKNSYLYGWDDDSFQTTIHCLAEAIDRLVSPAAVMEIFGATRRRKGPVMKVDFSEIFKLKDMLDHAGIPNVYLNLDNEEAEITGRQIIYPGDDDTERVSDAAISYRCIKEDEDEEGVFNAMSLGAPLLEQMGLVDGTRYGVAGGRTAEQVFASWKEHYDNKEKK